MKWLTCILLISTIFIAACVQTKEQQEVEEMKSLKLTSYAFKHNEIIPSKYTCDGSDINPPLKIDGLPEDTRSLALIVDDPDAPMGIWVHWVVWNIPAKTNIEENSVPGMEGLNDFKRQSYGGPCPPDREHRYFFKLYALDVELDLPEGATKAEVEKAMEGHILAEAKLMGRYERIK